MASFTVRVELHDDPTSEDYDTLHEAMENEGFSRIIKDSKGTEYHLPDAEYIISGSFTKQNVLQKAKNAASQTGKDYSVLVTESNGRTWYNLKSI